jgi:hypothetical protein
MAALNRRLHAQLGGAARRGGATEALEELALADSGAEPRLVRVGTRAFIVEGDRRREVPSSIVAAALAEKLGRTFWADEGEIEHLREGPAVEIYEGPYDPPFVVVGGKRVSIRGLPLPIPVDAEQLHLFPRHEEINLAAANAPRHRVRLQVDRVRSVAEYEGGVVSAAGALAARAQKRARRVLDRFAR